ncbi:hypothetical protein NQX30_05550 [Candidatus Persebacteraceae bacterium Df01]|jgi:hypothetical protein|uniref:Uncharacterized protein n=1 Tax=Candidatus Doriopsillibacter californiensis TaxID=2970740 RepID=A0ABT7QM94_9GAMM|nr:hypothetical protein [Candidatus Persebacteraceae bacterium Df01]
MRFPQFTDYEASEWIARRLKEEKINSATKLDSGDIADWSTSQHVGEVSSATSMKRVLGDVRIEAIENDRMPNITFYRGEGETEAQVIAAAKLAEKDLAMGRVSGGFPFVMVIVGSHEEGCRLATVADAESFTESGK